VALLFANERSRTSKWPIIRDFVSCEGWCLDARPTTKANHTPQIISGWRPTVFFSWNEIFDVVVTPRAFWESQNTEREIPWESQCGKRVVSSKWRWPKPDRSSDFEIRKILALTAPAPMASILRISKRRFENPKTSGVGRRRSRRRTARLSACGGRSVDGQRLGRQKEFRRILLFPLASGHLLQIKWHRIEYE
jgi:hypothetical protein